MFEGGAHVGPWWLVETKTNDLFGTCSIIKPWMSSLLDSIMIVNKIHQTSRLQTNPIYGFLNEQMCLTLKLCAKTILMDY